MLSRRPLPEIGAGATVLCANHRLARILRQAADRRAVAAGQRCWRPMNALTLAPWLHGLVEEALLGGAIRPEATPRLVLSPLQERIVWDRAIQACCGGDDGAILFDRDGLAEAAAEANALMITWSIRPAAADCGDETRHFLAWRTEFRRICDHAGWWDGARLLAWQIDCLAGGAGSLPDSVAFAGFDRYDPQEQRLIGILQERGVHAVEVELGVPAPAPAVCVGLADRESECRAAAEWARRWLEHSPAARIGIVVPTLGRLRDTLSDALDAALHPGAVGAAEAQAPRRYNISLGRPLAAQPMVDVALRILRLAALPHRISQSEIGALLRAPYWSAEIAEGDARAQLEARMRRLLPPELSLGRLRRLVAKFDAGGILLARLSAHLEALQEAVKANATRQLPSRWAVACRALLAMAGWPGERSLSGAEYQARHAFLELSEALGQLDAVLGPCTLAEAVRRLSELCRERVFQPETQGDPPVQVMGPLEAAGPPVDALWVMGMNDSLWPPPARPNPLLPAGLQRHAASPGASAVVQDDFALAIHERLLHGAPEVVFSWARGEADRELRPSPLLNGMPSADAALFAPAASPCEARRDAEPLESVDDALAPPLGAGEGVRGGTTLLRAQAICPAWAFHRYRLGAAALEMPSEGIDAAERGSLVHQVLARFWPGRSSADLLAMSPSACAEAVAVAVAETLRDFAAAADEPPPPRLLGLEDKLLRSLVGRWLEVEAERTVPFRVVACEESLDAVIDGIAVRLVVDRIDELADGRRIIIDYKTGRQVGLGGWAGERITEPQLPIYALEAGAPPAAVAFARVRTDLPGFVGLGAEAGLLPEVGSLDGKEARKHFAEAEFPDWAALLGRWQERIAAIAREIRDGVAAVRFERERDLDFCEVKPLLRLAERRRQWEDGGS